MAEALQLSDIQGIVASAYTHQPFAAYVLLRVDREGAPAARAWLGTFASKVTTAQTKDPEQSLNIAFTHEGLQRLGLDTASLASFPTPYVDGMASPRRAKILGDDSDKLGWGCSANPVDMLVMAFAETKSGLVALETGVVASAKSSGLTHVDTLYGEIRPDCKEHFGFVDGIGQPVLESFSTRASRTNGTRVVRDRDVVRDGEFVLGYENEYGYRAEWPKLGPGGELGRNGTYLVFRQTSQDVGGFREFVRGLAATGPYSPDDIAAKIVGRWPSGAPLVKTPMHDDPAYALRQKVVGATTIDPANDFGFAEDPDGFACPLGSHVRRSNPRDGSLHTQTQSAPVHAERHRLLRRGRSYGPRYDEAGAQDAERGLHFISLCADLERQFEFVQQTWIDNPALNDLDEVDPLVGGRDPNGTFTIQAAPLRRRLHEMRSFVAVRGGAYFFLPGLKALAWLAAIGGRPM